MLHAKCPLPIMCVQAAVDPSCSGFTIGQIGGSKRRFSARSRPLRGSLPSSNSTRSSIFGSTLAVNDLTWKNTSSSPPVGHDESKSTLVKITLHDSLHAFSYAAIAAGWDFCRCWRFGM
jgi:hypothetical protein